MKPSPESSTPAPEEPDNRHRLTLVYCAIATSVFLNVPFFFGDPALVTPAAIALSLSGQPNNRRQAIAYWLAAALLLLLALAADASVWEERIR